MGSSIPDLPCRNPRKSTATTTESLSKRTAEISEDVSPPALSITLDRVSSGEVSTYSPAYTNCPSKTTVATGENPGRLRT